MFDLLGAGTALQSLLRLLVAEYGACPSLLLAHHVNAAPSPPQLLAITLAAIYKRPPLPPPSSSQTTDASYTLHSWRP